MRLSRASSRYAKAILSLAIDENKAVAVNEDMKNIDNLKIITSNVELSGLEVETAGDNKRAFFLRTIMSQKL